jgi:hypothetical protein
MIIGGGYTNKAFGDKARVYCEMTNGVGSGQVVKKKRLLQFHQIGGSADDSFQIACCRYPMKFRWFGKVWLGQMEQFKK